MRRSGSDSAERDSRRIDVALSFAQVGRESAARAARSSEQHRCLPRPVGPAMLDEVEEGRLGPVQVVQHDDERALTRDPLEERPGSPGRSPRRCAFTGDPFGRSSSASVSSSRGTSIGGQYVMPSPYGRQRPSRIVASPSARSRNSRTRRDLPIPAVPRMVNRWRPPSGPFERLPRAGKARSRDPPSARRAGA